ncbi:hypothetical protein ACTG2I_11190 [Aeromonas caviae]
MDKSFRLAPLSCVLIAAVGCSSQQMQNFKSTVNDIGKDYGMPVLCGAGMIAGGAAGYAINGKKGLSRGLPSVGRWAARQAICGSPGYKSLTG